MSLSPQFLDELRARTSLSALVGRTVKLKKAGSEWQACCPFHQEKTASFYVNDEKAFFHCFGCQAHGDAIRWLQESQGMEFLDAVRQLAEAAGMEMPARNERQDDRAAGLYPVLADAAGWFADQLMGIEGAGARAYLERRGIGPEAVRAFGLGFAPDSRGRLRSALAHHGEPQLVEAGLLVDPEDWGRDPYDRFRGRLIFPIHDARGRVIAFGGRILESGEPKYLNSPDSPVFDKGRTLFNMHRAAPIARKAARIVAVEGQMDVIALWQVGIGEAVAPLGSALTEAQIGLLWRVNPSPILCFDGDAAGGRATAKAAIRALPGIQPERTLRFISLPPGQDPDDIARAGGAVAIEDLFGKPASLADLLWAHEQAAGPLDSPEAKAALRERLVAHARTIEHQGLRHDFEQEFRARIDKLFERTPPAPRVKGRKKGKPARPRRTGPAADLSAITSKMVAAVLRGLARHPDVARERSEQVGRLPTPTPAHQQGLGLILDVAFGGAPIEPAVIDDLFPGERGWHGLVFTFLKPATPPRRAESDLAVMIDSLVAAEAGAPVEQLAKMAREYVPPEMPPPGKLL